MTAEAVPAERRWPRWLPWIVAGGLTLVFLGHDAGRLTAPFGPSHDGFNAALFMTGGRAIVEEGPMASRLGARSGTLFGDRVVYAHHPPLIYWISALAYLLPGPVELRAHLPAVVASLAFLVIAILLLEWCGVEPGAASVGLLLVFGSRMFLVFGAVIEPHALGLTCMAAITLLWQRSRSGVEIPWWAFALVAAAGALTSWEAYLFGILVGVALLLERRRNEAAAVIVGVAIGAALTGFWILWAYGGHVGEFLDRALLRAGAGATDRVTILQMVKQQAVYLHAGFPVGRWLVVPVAALGMLDRRTRPLVAVSLTTEATYAIAFKNGAFDHSYWMYGLLLSLLLGSAVAADRAAQWLSRRGVPRFALAAMAGCLAILVGVGLWRPSDDEAQNWIGAAIGADARTIAWPANQRYAYHAFGGTGPTDMLPWLRFYARREPMGVGGPASVPQGQLMLRMVDGHLRVVPGEQTSLR